MKVGVVAGRFQSSMLHTGHATLLTQACKHNDYVLVFIGVSAISGTKRNPLDYVTRSLMVDQWIMDEYDPSDTEIFYQCYPIKDCEDDHDWSLELDHRIEQEIKYGDEVTLYGGEDSFLDCYSGKHKCVRLDTTPRESATSARKLIVNGPPKQTEDFREGVIYGLGNLRDTVACTVDVACITQDNWLLVGRKRREKLWRFPGGFVDAADISLEAAAKREFREETSMSAEGQLHYVTTSKSDDWRWRNSPDKSVMTTLFATKYSFGHPAASDDLEEVKWIRWMGDMDQMNKTHQGLYATLYKWLRTGGSDALQLDPIK